MPVQTRGRSKPSSTSAVYSSTAAAPEQKQFPHRRHQVRKTYGRPKSTMRKYTQGTLTQMDFVTAAQEDLLDPLHLEEDDDYENEEPVQDVKSKQKRRSNRRKTTGDELDKAQHSRGNKRRKTMGDIPNSNSSASSSFHTQTLTQFLQPKDANEDVWQIKDSEDEEDEVDDDLGSGLVMETPRKARPQKPSPELDNDQTDDKENARPELSTLNPVQSVTPSNRKIRTEIPSSQSPLTPMLMRYNPMAHNSPMKTKSSNADASSSTKKAQKFPKDRVIPDSYSTSHSSPVTPSVGSVAQLTPVKRLRFDIPEDKENITPGRTKPKSPKPFRKTSRRQPLREVPDSDEEVDETEEDEGEDDDQVNQEPESPLAGRGEHVFDQEADPEPADSYFDVIGEETQAELISSTERLSHDLGVDEATETAEEIAPDRTTSSADEEETPRLIRDAGITPNSAASVVEQSPMSSPHRGKEQENEEEEEEEEEEEPPETFLEDEYLDYTQGQSQRLPLETVRALAPQTTRSDIMVSLHPEHLAKILNKTKNHEFRAWKIPDQVYRVWIYTTKPAHELRYMCVLSPAKAPGEIEDEAGIGNKDFNENKKIMKYAYEILELYELNNPVSLAEMKSKGWVSSAPQKFTYIPPAVVGELTANLRCALIGPHVTLGGASSARAAAAAAAGGVSESQELREQIETDMEYSTQHHSSSQSNHHPVVVIDDDDDEEVIPLSQPPRRRSSRAHARRQQQQQQQQQQQESQAASFVRPALPKTQSSTYSLPPLPRPPQDRPVRPSQATTVSSSTGSPEKSLPLPPQTGSVPLANAGSSSPTMYRLRSSQFPTRSQMLPDSLVNEQIEAPPPIIWDSEEEEEEEDG
ncbi:hypothetical protein F4778DRAFT_537471 [Xylariomycetidae sp. FL2044]|nr:hypothetical protein F4778DRAFT_537471 [Xylariomycetidae sp. FL2044]